MMAYRAAPVNGGGSGRSMALASCLRGVYTQPMTTSAAERKPQARPVAFRASPDEQLLLEALADAVDPHTVSGAIRWILAEPTVRHVIRTQINGS